MYKPNEPNIEKLLGEDTAEIIQLKTRIAELEQQLSTQTENLENAKHYSRLLEYEINDINNKAFTVQRTNTQLRKELSEEGEKVRSQIKSDVMCLYRDWLDFENADVSRENYEALQTVIKKVFLSLEKNGIDFNSSDE